MNPESFDQTRLVLSTDAALIFVSYAALTLTAAVAIGVLVRPLRIGGFPNPSSEHKP